MYPGVNSASKNEYRDTPGGKGGRCVRLTTYHLDVPIVEKSVGRNLLEPCGPVQAYNGTALPFTYKAHTSKTCGCVYVFWVRGCYGGLCKIGGNVYSYMEFDGHEDTYTGTQACVHTCTHRHAEMGSDQ